MRCGFRCSSQVAGNSIGPPKQMIVNDSAKDHEYPRRLQPHLARSSLTSCESLLPAFKESALSSARSPSETSQDSQRSDHSVKVNSPMATCLGLSSISAYSVDAGMMTI